MSNEYVTVDDDLRTRHNYTIGRELIKTFGITPFWKREEEFADYQHPLPDCIVHNRYGEEWGHPGGTNWFAVGDKGSGKTTLALWLSAQLIDRNHETVVWRGSQARSEWLPYKRWTTLYLPAELEVSARWRPEHNDVEFEEEPADIETVVRDIERYHGLEDLLGKMASEEFAVVYPDPAFRGCNHVMAESSYCPKQIEYVSAADADEMGGETPLVHWWIAFALARVEGLGGHYDWTSLVFDEVADLLPESAESADQSYEKLEVMRRILADSRKYGFSFYAFGHQEKNVHHKIRSTFEWRVAMPDDNGNPCRRQNDSPPVGFSHIEMVKNFLKNKGPGYGLCWKPNNFTPFKWTNIPDWKPDTDRVLRIEIESPADIPARVTDSEADTGGSPETEVADD
jgi:energy-coupling factor transporter ATP-binding protein EcfA2